MSKGANVVRNYEKLSKDALKQLKNQALHIESIVNDPKKVGDKSEFGTVFDNIEKHPKESTRNKSVFNNVKQNYS